MDEPLPELKDGEFLYRSLYISVDSGYKNMMDNFHLPCTMKGYCVAVIEESRNKKFLVGSEVKVTGGWVERGIEDPNKHPLHSLSAPWVFPKLDGVSASMMLGCCGTAGITAYYGLLRICEPRPGDVVVVSGASGAVGSIAGQIAKIQGCKVIGLAGTNKKVNWLKEIGFDFAFNYKEVDITEAIKNCAPEGVDCYFDNVGGPITLSVMHNMKKRGRVALCGAISLYSDTEPPKYTAPLFDLIWKELRIEGFLFTRWASEYEQGVKDLAKWIKAGDIKHKETMVHGFQSLPQAFLGLFDGSNIGKMIVKV